MNLGDLLLASAARLERAGVYSPRGDAEIIVSRIIHLPRESFAKEMARELGAVELAKIEAALKRREKREPVARIFDGSTFCGLPVKLEEGVFEPLAESENLIEHALLFLQDRGGAPRVLDVGTGTGCLLLGVLSAVPQATGLGVDISEKAVDLAMRNAAATHLTRRAEFKVNDWTKGLEGPFDLILSNPPFIPKRLIKGLVPEVREHDPHVALEGGFDGMRYYRRLARDFSRLAAPGALGLFQVSLTFAEQAAGLFRRAGYAAEIKRNYYGIPIGVSVLNQGRQASFIKRLCGGFASSKTARSG